MKKYLDIDVLEASKERISQVFDNFEHVYVSFSGGKDSGVMLNLVLEEAKKRDRLPLDVLFVDLESQYKHTIDYVESMMNLEEIRPHWLCLPIKLRNAVSQFQPYWIPWDDNCEEIWVRKLPTNKGVIHDEFSLPFFRKGMEFEELIPLYGEHIANGKTTACFVGIRSDESLNRFRTIASTSKTKFKDWQWSTLVTENVYNVYPIYDWRTEDIWAANYKCKWSYNKIYDLMHLAGVSLSQMRICQPYGDDQRRGLWLFKILEPDTWARVVARVEGVNFGARYANEQGEILGNFKVILPEGYTYERYAKFLLETMPPFLKEHYLTKINKFISWWEKNGEKQGFPTFPDFADAKLEAAKKAPSWRRICKVLLKNDYWCKGLSFSQTKKDMENQLQLVMKYMDY